MQKRLWYHKRDCDWFYSGFHLSKDITENPDLKQEYLYFRILIKIVTPFFFYFIHDNDLVLKYK